VYVIIVINNLNTTSIFERSSAPCASLFFFSQIAKPLPIRLLELLNKVVFWLSWAKIDSSVKSRFSSYPPLGEDGVGVAFYEQIKVDLCLLS
jgi:hypothetical protein